ncbi:MAG: single-stranded-DNA-specific exonuclease RecJ [Clostridiales bacterium]|nr:single-stranded-DNA-specific exonuclease RecJ [Clostridiales bacterium]
MENRWTISFLDEKIEIFEDIHPIIQRILRLRGFTNKEDMLDFLSDKPQSTYDPSLMKNMDRAADLVLQAVTEGKNICIYGDYDVDGISSVSLMMELFSYLTPNCRYYIPSRFEEGYGLNKEALKHIKEEGTDLVITVDCGAAAIEEVKYAKEIGLDIIITDHHNVREELPDCLIVNPKQKDCMYPFKEICGCGVAFKLAQMIQRKANLNKGLLLNLLDLTAIATVSDVVPLVDENRVFVKYGLSIIRERRRKGLSGLIEGVGLNEKIINAYHIAFILGPHLNAGGRVDTAETGVKLLLSKDKDEINELTRKLVEFNRERKNIQNSGFEKCIEIVDANHREDLFLVLEAQDIHEGVAGIIAGKIKERYYRPTIIVTKSKEEGIYKGTGRSIENLDMFAEMKKFENLFVKFGGHSSACGFSIEINNLFELRKSLNEEMAKIKEKDPDCFIQELKIALELKMQDLTMELIDTLNKLEPFGHKNERPLFLIRSLEIFNVSLMGPKKEHIKFICKDEHENILEAVGFNMSEKYKTLDNPRKIDLVGFPEKNSYNGVRKIQFLISDFKKAQ